MMHVNLQSTHILYTHLLIREILHLFITIHYDV
jgi:hypothetical protein